MAVRLNYEALSILQVISAQGSDLPKNFFFKSLLMSKKSLSAFSLALEYVSTQISLYYNSLGDHRLTQRTMWNLFKVVKPKLASLCVGLVEPGVLNAFMEFVCSKKVYFCISV